MTKEQRPQWQQSVAKAIIDPSSVSAAEKLHLLTEWPILRAWANAALKRDPEKIPTKTLDAYLRDALAWSGHLGNPSEVLNKTTHPAASSPVNTRASVTRSATNAKEHKDNRPDFDGGFGERKQKPCATLPAVDGEENPRPAHFDQYRKYLPEELQQRFDEEISDLYLLRADLANRRDQLADMVQQAMYAGEEKTEEEASAQLADVAQRLVNTDETIRSFWALVDVAFRYYQLNGEVMTIEDLRLQATVPVDSSAGKRRRAPRTPDYTKAEIEAMPEGDEREAAKADRIRKNFNFLRDKRKADKARANGGDNYEKWAAQILLRAKEMEEWGETLTSVQQEIVSSVLSEVQ